MLQIFPWLAWLAVVVSGVLLFLLWTGGELSVRSGAVLLSWFLIAASIQFFTTSALGSAAGLGCRRSSPFT